LWEPRVKVGIQLARAGRVGRSNFADKRQHCSRERDLYLLMLTLRSSRPPGRQVDKAQSAPQPETKIVYGTLSFWWQRLSLPQATQPVSNGVHRLKRGHERAY